MKSEFELFKNGTCPVCNGEHKSCRQNGDLIHCRSHNEAPAGYKKIKDDALGFAMYAPIEDRNTQHRGEKIPVLSIQQRDAKIRACKAKLSDHQIADLLGRGLAVEQITYAINNHWLFALDNGYGISAIDATTGMFCGAQKANDDRSTAKYTWGVFSGDNKLKETGENSLFLWVHPKFDHSKPYEIKYTEGALKSLIRGFFEWKTNRNVIVIGAAAGIFGKKGLDRIFQKYPKAIAHTLLCDANTQDEKKLNILTAYKRLAVNVPTVLFADWGQWQDKTKGDCDETFGTDAFDKYELRSPSNWLDFFRGSGLLDLASDPTEDIDPESFIVGSLLLAPRQITTVTGIIATHEAFQDPLSREICAACYELNQKNQPIDVLSVHKILTDKGLGDKISQKYLVSLKDRANQFGDIDIAFQAQIISDRYTLRLGEQLGNEVARLYAEGGDVKAAIAESQKKLAEFAVKNVGFEGFVNAGEILREQIEAIEEEKAKEEDLKDKYLSTGIPELDDKLELEKGSSIGIIAVSSHGKTTTLFFVAQHLAVIRKQTVLIASLEVGKKRAATKFAQMETGFTNRMIKTNTFFDLRDKSTFESVVEAYEGGRICIYDSSPVVEDFCDEVEAYIATNGATDLVIMVDYLQLFVRRKPTGDTRIDLEYCAKKVDALRKKHGFTLFELLQPTAAVEARQDKRPKLADTKDMPSMARQLFDVGLYLYRGDRYEPQTPDRGLVEIGCEKNRDGEAGWTVKPVFDGYRSRIGNSFVSILDQQRADYVPPQQLQTTPQYDPNLDDWDEM
jgi:replicative DNA helicase